MIRIVAFAATFFAAFAIAISYPVPAFANKKTENHNNEKSKKTDKIPPEWREKDRAKARLNLGAAIVAGAYNPPIPKLDAQAATPTVRAPWLGVFQLSNEETTLQPGEPTEGGLMTSTAWSTFRVPGPARIVVHTFGSEIDTVLAAYRGTALDDLTRLAGNDNTPVPGIGNTSSLIQFNVAASTDYAIQIGSRANAQGDISLNVFVLPPVGGLAAFLIQYGGSPINGRSYTCENVTGGSLQCPAAKFILFNAMAKDLTVTPSTTFGTGVTSLAPFLLKSHAIRVVEFKFGASFSRVARTQSGDFVFTGRSGGSIQSTAKTSGLIIVRPNAIVDDLVRAQVSVPVQTGYQAAPLTFTARLTNTGTVTGIGCNFHSKLYSDLQSSFYEIDPANGARLRPDNAPVNIAPHTTRTFKVTVLSQAARDADHIDPEVIGDCANNNRRTQPLRGDLDITASGYETRLPSLSVYARTPGNGVLNVPASGFAYYTFRVKNTQLAEPLNALPAYVGPFDDPANTKYTAAICRTNLSTGLCIGPYASSVSFNPTKGVEFGFSVRVKAPTSAPAYDPDQRRVFVNFKMANAPYYHIAAPSIAVRKN